MVARARKAAFAAFAVIVLPPAEGFYHAGQTFCSPAFHGGVDFLLRFGGKTAPAILIAALLPSASATTTSSVSAQSSSTDVDHGSDETCGPEDVDCQGDTTDEMTFSLVDWIGKLFVWLSVARMVLTVIIYTAGTAMTLFAAIKRMLSSLSGGGRTPGARAVELTSTAPPAIIIPPVFPVTTALSTPSTVVITDAPSVPPTIATAPPAQGGATANGGGARGGLVPRLARAISNTESFLSDAHEGLSITDDVLNMYDNL